MPKLNIPTASRNWTTNTGQSYHHSTAYEIHMRDYFRENDVPRSIRTKISTGEMHFVEAFAKDSGFPSMRFGYYAETEPSSNGIMMQWMPKSYTSNYICYTLLSPSDDELELLLMMKLKHGSLDNAYKEYRLAKGKK